MARPDTAQLKSLLESSSAVTLLLPQAPSYDSVASALSLKLSLESSGKSITIACPDPMTVEFSHLVGIDAVTSSFGSRNLVISFPGQTEHVDKVSYNLEQGELQLIITPKSDAPHLDHRRLRFTPAASKTDLVILVNVRQLLELGPLYSDAKNILASTQLVSVTHSLPQENYTPYQLYDPDASSLSELVAHLIDTLNLQFPADVATNLLAGLDKATQGFSHTSVSPSTFEVAAHLLRRGARRHHALSAEAFPPGSIPTQPYTQAPPPPSSPPPASEPPQTPDDWYAPKIYHGPMLQ